MNQATASLVEHFGFRRVAAGADLEDPTNGLGLKKSAQYFDGLQASARRRLADLAHPQAAFICCDGACSGNGTSASPNGGWGFILASQDAQQAGALTLQAAYGGERPTTNNRMELTAAIAALELLPASKSAPILLVTDSTYVIKGCTEWRAGWVRRGMRNGKNEPVANPDLWKRLWALVDERQVDFEWVRGHSGDPANELADLLALKGAAKALA